MKKTMLKHTEEMLSKYEFIVNTSKEFMTIINKNYQYEAVNRAYMEAMEKQESEIIGKTVQEVWKEKQFEQIIEPNLKAAFQGKEIHYQSWFSFPKRDRRYFDVAIYPYQNENDEVTHLVIVNRDITEQKLMENQLRKAEKLAAVGELAAGVAHEIRNPIAIMKSTAQYIYQHYSIMTEEKIKKAVNIFIETSDRIDKIVKDLLEFTKPREIFLTEKSLIPILEKAIYFTNELCLQNGIKVEFAASKKDIIMRLDENKLYDALINLLMNAVEAQPHGGKIKIVVAENFHQIKLTIQDEGKGIVAKDLPNVFNPFYTTKPNGTGLGLSIVYQIITEHNGSIDITAGEKRGTKVTIQFNKYGVEHG